MSEHVWYWNPHRRTISSMHNMLIERAFITFYVLRFAF